MALKQSEKLEAYVAITEPGNYLAYFCGVCVQVEKIRFGERVGWQIKPPDRPEIHLAGLGAVKNAEFPSCRCRNGHPINALRSKWIVNDRSEKGLILVGYVR